MTESNPITHSSVQGSTLVVTILADQVRDMSVSQKLREEIISQFKSSGANSIVLDFSHVRFIASVAFLAFLGVRRQEGVKRIFVCNLDENIREVFAICKLIPTANHATAPFEEAASIPQALERCSP